MTYQHVPTTWSDGQALTAANSANRWETAALSLSNDLADVADDVGALQSFVIGSSFNGYRFGATADAGPPTLGSSLFYNQTTNELWIPGGAAWNKVALTAVSGVSGGSNAPTGFTADVQPDSSINLAWTLPTPPGGNTITAVTVREKFKSPTGVSGMPLAGSATSNTRPSSTTASTREYYVTCSFSGGTESAESNHVTVVLPYGSTGSTTGGGSTGGTGATASPASVLNIGTGATQTHFSVDVGNAGGANISHTMQEIIDGFVQDGYFGVNSTNDAVAMQCYANSGTTSSTTAHPRTELREVLADKTTKAAWTAGSGRSHTMFGTSTITHLPADAEASGTPKPQVCFAQIHDAKGDVVRLQVEPVSGSVSSLNIKSYTHSPDGGGSEVKTTIASSYTVGTAINWKIEVINTTCNIYLGGTISGTPGAYTYTGGTVVKTFTISLTGGYFKSGDYQQFSTAVVNSFGNPDGGYKATSYATTELKNLFVTHSPAL